MGIVSADDDGFLRLWNCDVAGPVLNGHSGTIRCILPLPENAILSGSDDGTEAEYVETQRIIMRKQKLRAFSACARDRGATQKRANNSSGI